MYQHKGAAIPPISFGKGPQRGHELREGWGGPVVYRTPAIAAAHCLACCCFCSLVVRLSFFCVLSFEDLCVADVDVLCRCGRALPMLKYITKWLPRSWDLMGAKRVLLPWLLALAAPLILGNLASCLGWKGPLKICLKKGTSCHFNPAQIFWVLCFAVSMFSSTWLGGLQQYLQRFQKDRRGLSNTGPLVFKLLVGFGLSTKLLILVNLFLRRSQVESLVNQVQLFNP